MPKGTLKLLTSVASVLSLGSASALAQQDVPNQSPISKDTLFEKSGLDFDLDGLYKALPQASKAEVTKKAWGTLPEFCYKSTFPKSQGGFLGEENHCDPYDMESYDVKFSDCDDVWQFCRCNNAPWSIAELVEQAGRLPVSTRQYTRSFTSYAIKESEKGTYAYAFGPDIAFIDKPDKRGLKLPIFLHENAHTVDATYDLLNKKPGSTAGAMTISNDAAYKAAMDADSCITDSYAKTNLIESYAQMTVLASYDINVKPISEYKEFMKGEPTCLQRQLEWVENRTKDTFKPGGRCKVAHPNQRTVCMGPRAGCGNAGDQVQRAQTEEEVKAVALPSAMDPFDVIEDYYGDEEPAS